MKRITDFLDSLDFSPVTMVLTIFGLATMRLFLENFSSPEATGLFAPIVGVMSYTTLYGMLILLIGFLLSWLSKKSLMWALRVIVLVFPVILLTPIIDLIWSGGSGFCIGYAQTGGNSLWYLFTHLLAPHEQVCGITPGLRFQIIFIVIGLAGLVAIETKSVFQSVAMGIGAYTIAFIGGALPNIISKTFPVDAMNSLLATIHYPTDSLFFTPITSSITTVLLGRVQFLFFLLFLGIAWFIISRKTWIGWWKGFYAKLPIAFIHVTLLIFGIWTGSLVQPNILSWPDIVGIITVIVTLLLVCSVVGIENDINDFTIDRVSNKSWWLVDQGLTIPQLRTIQILSLLFAVSGAFLISHNVFFGLMTFMATYFVHSSGLRLKRFWPISTFLITLSGMIAFITGYFVLSADQTVHSIPLVLILMIGIILIPYSILKDIPDMAGDRIGNIKTFPLMFGTRPTLITIAILAILWLVIFWSIIPWFFTLGVIAPIVTLLIKPHLLENKFVLLGLPVSIWFIGVLLHILIF